MAWRISTLIRFYLPVRVFFAAAAKPAINPTKEFLCARSKLQRRRRRTWCEERSAKPIAATYIHFQSQHFFFTIKLGRIVKPLRFLCENLGFGRNRCFFRDLKRILDQALNSATAEKVLTRIVGEPHGATFSHSVHGKFSLSTGKRASGGDPMSSVSLSAYVQLEV